MVDRALSGQGARRAIRLDEGPRRRSEKNPRSRLDLRRWHLRRGVGSAARTDRCGSRHRSGRVLAVSRAGELAMQLRRPSGIALGRVSIVGGSVREVMENASRWADWSPDGKFLMIQRHVGGKDRIEYPLGTVFYESEGKI